MSNINTSASASSSRNRRSIVRRINVDRSSEIPEIIELINEGKIDPILTFDKKWITNMNEENKKKFEKYLFSYFTLKIENCSSVSCRITLYRSNNLDAFKIYIDYLHKFDRMKNKTFTKDYIRIGSSLEMLKYCLYLDINNSCYHYNRNTTIDDFLASATRFEEKINFEFVNFLNQMKVIFGDLDIREYNEEFKNIIENEDEDEENKAYMNTYKKYKELIGY